MPRSPAAACDVLSSSECTGEAAYKHVLVEVRGPWEEVDEYLGALAGKLINI